MKPVQFSGYFGSNKDISHIIANFYRIKRQYLATGKKIRSLKNGNSRSKHKTQLIAEQKLAAV